MRESVLAEGIAVNPTPPIREVELVSELIAHGEQLRSSLQALAKHLRAENDHMQKCLDHHAELASRRDEAPREAW